MAREADLWWNLARATVGTAAKIAFRVRAYGTSNIPRSGGALLVFNHVSVIDSIFVSLPVADRGRVVRFMGLAEHFERPVMGWGLRRIRQIPIRRGLGDWSALQAMADAIGEGWIAGIAPEGTVGDGTTLQPGQKGAARIALLAGAPVIPVGLWGTQYRRPKRGWTFGSPHRPHVNVIYGAAIKPEGDPKYRPDVQALTDRIMEDIGALVIRARST